MRLQESTQFVASPAADHILVKDMPGAGIRKRQHHSVTGIGAGLHQAGGCEQPAILGGSLASLFIPFLDVFQLHQENGCLEGIEPAIPAHFVVVVAAAHAVVAQHVDSFGQSFVAGSDQPGISAGAQILGWVEAERREIA